MTVNVVHWNWPETISCFTKSWSGVEDPSDSPERSSRSSPRSALSRIMVDVLRSWSPPDSFTVPSATGNVTFSPLLSFNTPSYWVSRHGFQMRPYFPIPQCLRPLCHLSRFHPNTRHVRGIFQVNISYRTGGVLTSLWQKQGDIQSSNQMELLLLWMVRRIAVRMESALTVGPLAPYKSCVSHSCIVRTCVDRDSTIWFFILCHRKYYFLCIEPFFE